MASSNGTGTVSRVVLPAGVRSVTASADPSRPSMGQKRPPSRRQRNLPGSSDRAVVSADPFGEIGTSGLRQYGGFILEEWLTKLRGRYGAWAYREMMDNSPIAGGIIFAVKMLAKQVEWRVEDDIKLAGLDEGFVESCMGDMSHTWGDLISEVLSMLGYGWHFAEIVYKRRQGGDPLPENELLEEYGDQRSEDTDEVPPSSKFDDGRIGWRRLPGRAQETLMRWHFRGYAGLRAMEQIDWHGGKHVIPIGKALLFRTETTRQNPEGRALALDTPVPTPNGWTTMGELEPCSVVYDENEQPAVVTATRVWEDRPCMRLVFGDTSITADVNHEWPVGGAVFTTAQLAEKLLHHGERVEIGPCVLTNAVTVPRRTTRCIEVDSPSHLYLAGEAMVPTHNSLLRNAWTSYYAIQNIQAIEAIGIERDLAGLPVAAPPPGTDIYAPENAELLATVKELVTSVRRDEDEGVIMPSTDWEFKLMSAGGSRQIDTDAVIRRYENRMTTSVLADFLMIGQDSVGSYAMVDVKSELFGVAIDAILDLICEVFNRYAIPRLLALNGMKPDKLPRIAHSSAGRIDLRLVGEFLVNLSLAGAPVPWTENLLEHLFRAGALPEPDFKGPKLDPPQPSPAAHDSQWRPSWGSEDTSGQAAATPTPPAKPVEREHVSKAEQHSGAMVALYPSPDVARALAQTGGEDPEQLHLTLAFLGPAAMIDDPERLRQVVSGIAATTPPIDGRIAGSGVFTANDEPCSYAAPDCPLLPSVHHHLAHALERGGFATSSDHGFTPHITLAYGGEPTAPTLPATPLRFDTMSLVLAGERTDFPLSEQAVTKSENGHLVDLSGVLGERHALLSTQLEREMEGALSELGDRAARGYATIAQKSSKASADRLAGSVMAQTGVADWVRGRLNGTLRNHAARVTQDTARVVGNTRQDPVALPDASVKRVAQAAGKHMRVSDLTPQVREAVKSAIVEGQAAGDTPTQTAARIRDSVPKGRFRMAGMPWRAQLIARSETGSLQRLASLEAYAATGEVSHVQAHVDSGGAHGADTHVDGEVIPLEEARAGAADLHPASTARYSPIVGS